MAVIPASRTSSDRDPNRNHGKNHDKEKDDGSEFGLVPRHLLKRKPQQQNKMMLPPLLSSPQQDSPPSSGANIMAGPATAPGTPTKNVTSPPRIKRQQQEHDQGTPATTASSNCSADSDTGGRGSIIHNSNDCTKTEEELVQLIKETNTLLAKKWFISQWTADTTPEFQDEKLLLLKTEDYKPHEAARRIEEHIKTKVELFKLFGEQQQPPQGTNKDDDNNNNNGNNKNKSHHTSSSLMGKKICLYDLAKSRKNQVGIEDGYVQLVPARDLQGRAVVFFHFDAKLYVQQPQLFRKFLYYMMASALEDDETASKGIVLVVWNDDQSLLSILDPFWHPNAWGKIPLPYRISQLHYCQRVHDPSPYSVQEKRDRGVDMVLHHGSLHECMHGLVSYGVPAHFLPLNVNHSHQQHSSNGGGTMMTNNQKHENLVETGNHLRWVELRRRIESFPLDQQKGIVLLPIRPDVLLGKHRKTSMAGNVFYHQQLILRLKAYTMANTDLERDAISFEVYTAIADTHGRFLTLVEDSLWKELDQPKAHQVIRMAFDFLQSQATGTVSSSSSKGRTSGHNEYEPFDISDIFNGQQCWNLLHCKVGSPVRCW